MDRNILFLGAGVMERYWNDPELMSKIASKMGALKLSPGKPRPAKKAAQVISPPHFVRTRYPCRNEAFFCKSFCGISSAQNCVAVFSGCPALKAFENTPSLRPCGLYSLLESNRSAATHSWT